MKKILVSIHNDFLNFSYKNHQKVREDLINTNIISNDELLFSDDYIIANANIFSLFIKELCEMKKISKIVCINNNMADFILNYLQKNQFVHEILIKSDENITFSICEKLSHNPYIQHLHCFSISYFMMEHLDQSNIMVHSRGEILYSSEFMTQNDITYYSKIYYKKIIMITTPMSNEDYEDFLSFCKINRYLKVIKLNTISRNDIENIITALISNEIKHVSIKIYSDYNTVENIEYLKKINKKYTTQRIKCSIVYSKEYLMNNIFKQIILNTLKICGILITILVASVTTYVVVNNYISLQNDVVLNDKIKEQMKQTEEIDDIIIDEETKEEYVIKNKDIAALLVINPDVVGYLRVNNTNIDYPVVKGSDNDFYLTHGLSREKDKNGYIFMNYRNNEKELDQNTIIFGHNMYYSKIMFGQLHNTIRTDWYSNPDNLVISFNTLYETMNWQIFSIYKVDYTVDYLKTSFANENEYFDFVNLLKGRSVKNFNVEITANDKILTLSTCTGENQRLVVHAKLIIESTE